jgi:hypothetical protein
LACYDLCSPKNVKEMKKYLIILVAALLTIAVGSCEKFVQGYDVSPNSATTATLPLLLSSTEMGLQASYTGTLARVSGILTQQLAGAQFQMLDIASYSLKEGDNINDWNNIYDLVVQPCNDMIQRAGEKNPYYLGIAKVIKALGLGLATDYWGDVPANEAGMGFITGNLTPKYDAQTDVIIYMQQLLSDAITSFGANASDNILTPGADDFMLGGDVSKWTNIAKITKARYANRLSKIDPQGSATSALGFLQGTGNLGDLMATYGPATNENNQWYQFETQRADYLKAGKFLVDMLTVNNDPRLAFYFAKNAGGSYTGSSADSDAPDLSASAVGPFIASPASPIPLVTYTEALFIAAEANLRLNQNAVAATAYNNAVLTSINLVTGANPSPAFITAFASETAGTITLQKIMVQKYIAMFTNVEAWADWRRTGFPVLTPNPNGAGGGTAIPRRFPTVQDERTYNPNAVVVSDIYAHVWWDK